MNQVIEFPPLSRRLGSRIAAGDYSHVADIFHSFGTPAPKIGWSPDRQMLGSRFLSRFAGICDRVQPDQGPLRMNGSGVHTFGQVKDWMIRTLPRDDGEGYRVSHFGNGLTRMLGRDRSGIALDDLPGYMGTYVPALLSAVTTRERRCLSEHQPSDQPFVQTWRQLVVPVKTVNGLPNGHVIMSCPDNELRAGLEVIPMPVIIADEDMIVRYANKTACQTFDDGNYGPWARDLFDYAGLDLEIVDSPKEILKTGIAQRRSCRFLKHQQIGHYNAQISATRHYGSVFYVIMLQ